MSAFDLAFNSLVVSGGAPVSDFSFIEKSSYLFSQFQAAGLLSGLSSRALPGFLGLSSGLGTGFLCLLVLLPVWLVGFFIM